MNNWTSFPENSDK